MLDKIANKILKLVKSELKNKVASEDSLLCLQVLTKIAGDIKLARKSRTSPIQRLKMKRYYKVRKNRILGHMKKFYHRFKGVKRRPGGVTHHRRMKFHPSKTKKYKPTVHFKKHKRKSMFKPVAIKKHRSKKLFSPVKSHAKHKKTSFKPVKIRRK